MAHHQHQLHNLHDQPHYGGASSPPPTVVAELEAPDRVTMLPDGGLIYEMPGESAVPKKDEPTKRPAQMLDTDKPIQANPWPFYLEEVARPEPRQAEDEKADDGEGVGSDSKPQPAQVLADPWPYHGPPSPDQEGPSGRADDASEAQAAGDSPSLSSFYPAPLKISRPQPAAPASPPAAYKPYAPPMEDASASAAVAPLKTKSPTPSGDPHALVTTALPYRPYRRHSSSLLSAADQPLPASSLRQSFATEPSTTTHPSPSAGTPAAAVSPLQPPSLTAGSPSPAGHCKDGTAPHHFYIPESQAPNPPSPFAPGPGSSPAPPAGASVSGLLAPYRPNQYPLSPAVASQALAGFPHPPSASLPAPSPSAANSPYGPPPGSGLGVSYPQPHYINPAQLQSAYPESSTPPAASSVPPVSTPYPAPSQVTTLSPSPASSYDIQQPTYTPSAGSPAPVTSPYQHPASFPSSPQPPRPHSHHAAMKGDQPPQLSPQSPPPPYTYASTPRPGTQPPPNARPCSYHVPLGPAIAPHQHQYPTQPTYASPAGNFPPPPCAPPLPPRPAMMYGNQPQSYPQFGSGPQNAVSYPPPPKKSYNPAPAAGPPRPFAGSGGGGLFGRSAMKWFDKTSAMLENTFDAVLQGPPTLPPRPPPGQHYPPQPLPGSYPGSNAGAQGGAQGPPGPGWRR